MRRIQKRGRELRGAEQHLGATDKFAANNADADRCISSQRGRIDKTDERNRICQSHVSRLTHTRVRGARGGKKYFFLCRNLSRRCIEFIWRDMGALAGSTGGSNPRPSHGLVWCARQRV